MTCEVTNDKPEYGVNPKYHIISGGLGYNPKDFEEYLDVFKDETQPYLRLIKEVIVDNGMLGYTAEQCCNETLFKFSDGTYISFTWRGWGDLMSAMVGKGEGYMKYYM